MTGLKSRKEFASPMVMEEDSSPAPNVACFLEIEGVQTFFLSNKSEVGIIREFGSVQFGIRDLALIIAEMVRKERRASWERQWVPW